LKRDTRQDPKKAVQPINEHIPYARVQLITNDGRNLGVVARKDALHLATLEGLDLVLLSDQGSEGVPVVKIMDYGKVLYAKKKKQAEAKKHQKVIQIKEIKLRPKIGEHDFETKMRQAADFLRDGKHLKITVTFRGREMVTREERGTQLFEKIDRFFVGQDIPNLAHEKDARLGQMWSRMYYIKSAK
jgi:translation initiation factor IF-3